MLESCEICGTGHEAEMEMEMCQLQRRPDDPVMDGLEVLFADCLLSALARDERGDWRVRSDGLWCMVEPVGDRHRTQGWKVHVSATPLSAALVLARSVEVLVRHQCPFKFAARLDQVTKLVSRNVDRGSGGKFLTAYPQDDLQARAVAEELHKVTLGMPGPIILSDRAYRPGSLVHYRYGAFTDIRVLGQDGWYEHAIAAPDGSLVRDERKAWFTLPSWADEDPFADAGKAAKQAQRVSTDKGSSPEQVRLAGRYLVRKAVRHAYKGGVFRAVDERTGAPVIIKQARRHVEADLSGGDVRDGLRRESEMLEMFGSSGVTPRLVGLFEQQGDLFLVQEELAGVTLRQWVQARLECGDGNAWGVLPHLVDLTVGQLVDLVDLVHRRGLVLRDLKPDNIMVTADDQLWLIDLECLARPGEFVRKACTPGYAAPEQIGAGSWSGAPGPEADLFSMGAVLFYVVSGADPLLADDVPATRTPARRIADWLVHLSRDNAAARRWSPMITALLHEDPRERADLDAVRRFTASHCCQAAPPASEVSASGEAVITGGLGHLLSSMQPTADYLWAVPHAADPDPVNALQGAAGPLAVLALAFHNRPEEALQEAVRSAAYWICDQLDQGPQLTPGLSGGRSGTAWALLEAGLALNDPKLLRIAADLAQRLPLHSLNPGLGYGAAGAGLTQLRFWEVTNDDVFLARALQVADHLATTAELRDGLLLWPIPRSLPSVFAGSAHYDLANGVAGIGIFFLATGRATSEGRYLDLAVKAAETLHRSARLEDGAAFWPRRHGQNADVCDPWLGGPGEVGTFLVRVWEQTRDDQTRDLLTQAAAAVRRSRAAPAPGAGHFLVDLADTLGEPVYHTWANDVAAALYARHTLLHGHGVATSAVDNSTVVGAGLCDALGLALRLQHGGPNPWLPDILARAHMTAQRARSVESDTTEPQRPCGEVGMAPGLRAGHGYKGRMGR